MSGSEAMVPELWSTIMVRGGIVLMIAAAVLGIVSVVLLCTSKKRLQTRLDKEFGKKRH